MVIPGVAAQEEGIGGPADAVGDIFEGISEFFQMGIWDEQEQRQGLLRFLLFILVFTIIFSAGVTLFEQVGPDGHERRNAGVLATVISSITIIFTPPPLLNAIFTGYTTVIVFLLIALPVGLLYYLAYPVAGSAITNPIALRVIRIIGILLVWIILAQIDQFVAGDFTTQSGAASGDGLYTAALCLVPASWVRGDQRWL